MAFAFQTEFKSYLADTPPGSSSSVTNVIASRRSSQDTNSFQFGFVIVSGIVGVIHKATQGLTYKDPMYTTNRQKTIAARLLWGAYHFGVGGSGAAQADFFLASVNPDPDTLIVLDYEPNAQGATMSLDDARAFVNEVKAKVGRFPGLYSGSLIKAQLGNTKDPILAQCFFWLAHYGPAAVVPPNWPTWTLWQYTDGNLGAQPHTVPGIGPCDRDQFNGDVDGLKTLWGAADSLT